MDATKFSIAGYNGHLWGWQPKIDGANILDEFSLEGGVDES